MISISANVFKMVQKLLGALGWWCRKGADPGCIQAFAVSMHTGASDIDILYFLSLGTQHGIQQTTYVSWIEAKWATL